MKTDEAEPRSSKRKKSAKTAKVNYRWIITIFFSTIVISISFSFLSNEVLQHAGYLLAFLVLAAFIFVGIIFDIVGIAVTAADEKPFHSMAAHKAPAARESLRLLRNAEKVSSFCNDVVGDICGIISGTTSAVIVSRLAGGVSSREIVLSLVMSGLVAGATVGGKAVGKSFAMSASTTIVHIAGRVIYFFKSLRQRAASLFRKRKDHGG